MLISIIFFIFSENISTDGFHQIFHTKELVIISTKHVNLLTYAYEMCCLIIMAVIFICFVQQNKEIIELRQKCGEYEHELSLYKPEFNSVATVSDATESDATETDSTLTAPIDLHNDRELMKENGVVMVIPDKIEIEEVQEEYVSSSAPITQSSQQYYSTSGLTASGGVNYHGEQKETYYNLNMDQVVTNAQEAGIQGEYWVREDGVKMYGEYVIVAANLDVHPIGSTVETSLGTGIVLDTGGFATENPTQVDIATDW